MKKFLLYMLFLILIGFLILYFTKAFSEELLLVEYNIESDKINRNIKLAHISDLHSCYYGEEQAELLDILDGESPDVVLFTGDIADDDLPIFNTLKVIDYVGKKYPSYYVTGNHEYRSRYVEYIKEIFVYYNIKVLEGENQILEIGDELLNIAGVDDFVIGDREYDLQLKNASKDVDFQNYSLLLAHRPEHIEKYKKYEYDLVLSGHAHGGQWRIPKILNGFLAPNQGFFPKYAGGLYEHGALKHVISRGLARESTRIIPRIFNPPELVIINIRPKN